MSSLISASNGQLVYTSDGRRYFVGTMAMVKMVLRPKYYDYLCL
jgi:hypothetical protein